MNEQQQKIDNDAISLKELIQKIQEWIAYLTTQWKLIIVIAGLGGIIGFVYAKSKNVQYRASVIFTLEEDKPNFGQNSFGSQLLDFSSGGGAIFSKANLLAMLKSETLVKEALLEKVVINGRSTTLVNYFIRATFKKSEYDSLPEKLSEFRNDEILKIRSISNLLLQPIKLVDNYNKTSFIQISYTSNNELFANLFIHKILEIASKKYIKYKTEKTRRSISLLQSQSDSLRNKQEMLLNEIANESDNYLNLSSVYNIKKTSSQKKQFDLQILSTTLSQVVTNLEASKMSLKKETPLIFIIEDSELPLNLIEANKPKAIFIGILSGFIFLILSQYMLKWYKSITVNL
jgi:hypothetical protein